MDEDKNGQSVTDILSEARKRYRMCQDADSDNRINALDDLRFLTGGENQWDQRAVAARRLDGRPIITINTLPTYLHQITNDQRMNSPAIKVHPVDSEADPGTAKVIQGMIRHIEYESNADVAYDTAVNSAAAVGFGYFRLVTEYESEDSFDQCLRFKRIRNPLSVKIDPLSTEPDGSDMQFCFVESVMSRDDFKREYPDAEANNTSYIADGSNTYTQWMTENTVLVCEYYRIEKEDAEIVLLSTGESGYKDELVPPGGLPDSITIIKERPGVRCKVMWRKITGVDELEKQEIKCKWIPVFPVYGDEVDLEGKVVRSGIVRHAKGPAQMYNVMMTSATEEVSLRAKAPYIMAEGQEEGHEAEWAQANNRAFPFLTYKPVALGDKLAPAPQRNPMADVPAGMLAMSMHAQDNVKKTTGLFDASLGARGNATSGKQELAQQREGDMANFHYMDGLLRTIRHAGRCIVDMLPYYYDTPRAVRILGPDDSADFAQINTPNLDGKKSEDGKVRDVMNDLSVGKYDITVSSGPSYSTLRQEAAESMAENMAKNPALWPIVGDLYIKSQDWPGADEMAERLKKAVDPRFIEKEESDGEEEVVIQTPRGPLPAAKVPEVLQAMEGQLMQAGEALKKAQADKAKAEAMKAQNDQASLQIDAQRLQIEAANAETDRMRAETEKVTAEADRLKAEKELLIAAQCAQNEAAQADAALLASGADAMRAKIAAGEIQQAPSAEEIAALVASMRPPPPSGMTIEAPSGQAYRVRIQ